MVDNTVGPISADRLVYDHVAHSLRSNYICPIGAILLWCAAIAAQPTRASCNMYPPTIALLLALFALVALAPLNNRFRFVSG